MKMKHSVIASLLALGMTACVESTPSLQISGAGAQGADCSLGDPDEAGLTRGGLNLGIRPGGGYPLVLAVTSNLVNTPVEVGELPVSGDEDLNTIYITGMALEFEPRTSGLTFRQSSANVPLFGAVSAEGNLVVNLLTPDALTDLQGFVQQGSSAEVLVSVQFEGQRVSGDEVNSNKITFPLTVSNFPFSCPTGFRPVPSDDPCPQAGLNGAVPACEEVPAAP